jgi:nucleotide-binding universal stress UspA family protein
MSSPNTPLSRTSQSLQDALGAVHELPREILVPIDFSRASLAALAYAVRLAEGTSHEMQLMHAVTPMPVEEAVTAQQLLVEAAQLRLEQLAKPLRARGCNIVIVAKIGSAIDVIEGEVARFDPAKSEVVVVMGDRGLSAIRRTLLGSVADGALRRLRCPVIVVHENDELSDRLRVVIGYGFDSDSLGALGTFLALFGHGRFLPRVELVHVLPEYEWVEGTEVPLLRTPPMDDVVQLRAEELHAVAEALRKLGVDATSTVLRGEPARALLQRATDTRADLLVAGRRPRRALERLMFGSVAEGVTHRGKCAVLTACAAPVTSRPATRAMILT